MKKLSLWILCLFLTCKIFTQNDIPLKTKYVFLTEEQAKENIKELIAYDGLKEQYSIMEERIKNFEQIVESFKRIVENQKKVIKYKDSIIDIQDKIINNKKSVEFHVYSGIETWNLNFQNLEIYIRGSLEFKNISLGTRLNILPTQIYNIPNFYYNVYVEYKIF